MDFELRSLRGVATDALTRLAEDIFGRGERAPGWFARKLQREAVDPELSVLAVAAGASGHVPQDMLLGYFLIGQEPGDPVAHSAGLGVIAARRGGGLGRALVEEVAARLAARDFSTLRVLAEPASEAFYARLGLVVSARRVTLLAHGTCPISHVLWDRELADRSKLPWSPAPTNSEPLEVCAWRAGAWARTPPALAATLEPLPGAWAHVSREGRALLVQRMLVARDVDPAAAVAALLACTPTGMPLLLYGADPVSSITATLPPARDVEVSEPAHSRGEFRVAQRFAAMDLALRRRLDNPRRGDG
ncbi:GNAT family N-acetyltransferase [Nannocystis bainbridge]|uniref:GNAT family N-acetyltransferase n=1 Tax=Nannocystis bainbridge TaxID=2995303 RepID=A0ABT5E0W8_9BACT|nr:GNAT family N-acetyltransferase [Nannocystis bainbridge]MDC0719530.1 GNAT family N-acetyltransferase [Nannocystis bainbridge]